MCVHACMHVRMLNCCRYVLLHHVMGELEGIRNAWGYAEGGNGAVSAAIARAAQSHGAVLCTEMVGVVRWVCPAIISIALLSSL